jgi:acyl-CoA thioesterase I
MRSISRRADAMKKIGHAAAISRGTMAALVVIGLATGASIFFAPGHGRANAAIDHCAAPDEITTLVEPLPRVAERLQAGGVFTIVALGSSSTEGIGASRPENSYPSRLGVLLAARYPKLTVRVINRGIGGEEAADMAVRIDRQVLPEKPDLVIWQVGTNGVLHDSDPAAILEIVRRGIERIKASGSDVMLMNLQYAPAVLQHEEYHEMLRVLAAAAWSEDVPMFQRFALMRQWADDGQMSLAVMLAPDRLHMTDASYDCLARELTAGISHAHGATTTVAATQAQGAS